MNTGNGNGTGQIVNKAWSYAHVLRDDGLSYLAYTEQITFLLFLKMADEQTRPPYNRPPIVPPEWGWPSFCRAMATSWRRIIGARWSSWAASPACSAKSSSGRGPRSRTPPSCAASSST